MRKFVVAIAGGSASGKSTLAEAIVPTLSDRAVELIPMDRFMRRGDPAAPRFFFRFQGADTFDANHPESTDNAAAAAAIADSAADVVLVEGLMTLAVPEIRESADLLVFVDLDADIRAMRRMERDIRTGRSGGDPALIAAYYIECARVGHARYVEPSKSHADVIVRGDGDLVPMAGLLADLIRVRDPIASCR